MEWTGHFKRCCAMWRNRWMSCLLVEWGPLQMIMNLVCMYVFFCCFRPLLLVDSFLELCRELLLLTTFFNSRKGWGFTLWPFVVTGNFWSNAWTFTGAHTAKTYATTAWLAKETTTLKWISQTYAMMRDGDKLFLQALHPGGNPRLSKNWSILTAKKLVWTFCTYGIWGSVVMWHLAH